MHVLSCRHPSYFVGLLLQGAKLPYSNFGHVVLAKPSPILFYPISSVEGRTCGACNGLRALRAGTHFLLQSAVASPYDRVPDAIPLCSHSLHESLQAQVRCLVDVPGEELPSQVSGALAEYLSTHVANEVSPTNVQKLPIVSCKVLAFACTEQGVCILAGMLSL